MDKPNQTAPAQQWSGTTFGSKKVANLLLTVVMYVILGVSSNNPAQSFRYEDVLTQQIGSLQYITSTIVFIFSLLL